MKVYEGRGDGSVWIIGDGSPRRVPARTDLVNKSTQLSWGYAGSGPSQLALALLADVLDDERIAVALMHPFKSTVIATLPPGEPWQMSASVVRAIADSISRQCAQVA